MGSGGAEKDAALELQLIGGVRLFFGNTVQAARTSPLIRRIIHEAFEHASEVGLSTKAYSQGDLGKRQIGLAQKMLGPPYSLTKQIVVRTHSSGCSKLRREVHST